MSEVTIQLGLYGGFTELTDFHVVAAHTRVRADGTQVFVSEHLRWNRGRQGPRMPMLRLPEPDVRHPSLFGSATAVETVDAPAPEVGTAGPTQDEEADFAEAAGQLLLFGSAGPSR